MFLANRSPLYVFSSALCYVHICSFSTLALSWTCTIPSWCFPFPNHWSLHMSPLSVLFALSLDGDCSLVSGALSGCLHASTIPCRCSFKCRITFFLSLPLSQGSPVVVRFVCRWDGRLPLGYHSVPTHTKCRPPLSRHVGGR